MGRTDAQRMDSSTAIGSRSISMKRVFGDYTATRVLGKGSFGTVYYATHRVTGQTVALKEVLESALSDRVLSRLQMEISCQRAVDSPYVVKLLDSFSLSSGQYIALEYCAGGDLEKYLKRHGPVEEQVAQKWIRQLAQGFQELKTKKIMHRDLKVQNILLTEDSPEAIVKLGDFGMSKVMEEDLTTTRLGSPIYMAPEMFDLGSKYDLKADMWSFGFVCYQMLTGELPISAKFKSEIPSAQKALKPIPLTLSPACRELLAGMLEYDPGERISFDALATHPFVVGETVPDALVESEDNSGSFDLVEEGAMVEEQSEGDSPASHSQQDIDSVLSDLKEEMAKADLVGKVWSVVRLTPELYGAFALSVKRAEMLKATLDKCEDLIQSLELTQDLHPSLFACQARLVLAFTEAAARAEACELELENAVKRRGQLAVTALKDVDLPLAAEHLLFRYTLQLMSDATVDEFTHSYKDSISKYSEGVELLELISRTVPRAEIADLALGAQQRLDTARLKT